MPIHQEFNQNPSLRGLMPMPGTLGRHSMSGPINFRPQLRQFHGTPGMNEISPALAALQEQRRITQEQRFKKMNAARVYYFVEFMTIL